MSHLKITIIVEEDVWVSGPVWTGAKNVASIGMIQFALSFLSFVLSFLCIVYLYILHPHITYSSTTRITNIHAPGGIQTRDSRNQVAAGLRIRPHRYRDRKDSILGPSRP
jgi:hypothetical protein